MACSNAPLLFGCATDLIASMVCLLTGLGHDGTVIDTDKAVWPEGRAVWTFATRLQSITPNVIWLEAARCPRGR